VDVFLNRYGPWALVAGASEGIGEAFARELARRGLNLVLVARRSGPLEAAAREIAGVAKVQVRCLPLDLGRADAAAALAEELADLDVGLVVYNAALAPVGEFLQIPLDEQLAAIDVNVRGPLSVARDFGQRMAARGSGGIVLLSSLTAFQGSPFIATYGATKSFLLALARGALVRARAARRRRARRLRRRHAHAAVSRAREGTRPRRAGPGPGRARGPGESWERSPHDPRPLQPARLAADAPPAPAPDDDPDHGRTNATPGDEA
jgi:NADP-dependent 3-hydroxy acid dehydrogenase YdfG